MRGERTKSTYTLFVVPSISAFVVLLLGEAGTGLGVVGVGVVGVGGRGRGSSIGGRIRY